MKIGFCGPGASGKSSLLDYLTENKIVDCKKLPSVSRSVFARWGWNEEDQGIKPLSEVYLLQQDLFNERLKSEAEAGNCFISDRTLLDSFCYMLYRCTS